MTKPGRKKSAYWRTVIPDTANCGKIEPMGARSRNYIVVVVHMLVLGEGNLSPVCSTTSPMREMRIPKWRTAMKRLTILSFILGVLAMPVQAQAQSPAGTQVQSASFNGLFFDKSATGGYEGYPPPTRRGYRKIIHHRTH
jgi:hypothetical protein